jgi:hypothetical protein
VKGYTPLYRPQGRKCARVKLRDWLPLFQAASVGIPFYVHRDEIPNSAIRNMAHRIGVQLDGKFAVYMRPDNCFITFTRTY